MFLSDFILIDFLSVGATFGESGSSSSGLAEHNVAVSAQDYSLCMAENCGDLEAAGALDVHKKGIRTLHEPLKLVSSEFELRSRIQQIGWHSS